MFVGGIVFYIDNSADGIYRFWNADGQEVEAPTVGTDCTGWSYVVSDATKDKFYILHDEIYTSKRWTYRRNNAYVYELVGTSDAVGAGKSNTQAVMSKDSGAYITDNSNGIATIWYLIQQMRTNLVGGCNDWYVASKEEINLLRATGIVDWFNSNSFWSSSESSDVLAQLWYSGSKTWFLDGKNDAPGVFGIRSF